MIKLKNSKLTIRFPHITSYQLYTTLPLCSNMQNVIESLTASALQGDPLSCLRLGRLHYVGRGVPEDVGMSLALYYCAELSDDTDVLRELGRMFLEGDFAPEDPVRAAHIYRRAAGLGDRMSSLALGEMYRDGVGVERSAEKARECMRAAGAEV